MYILFKTTMERSAYEIVSKPFERFELQNESLTLSGYHLLLMHDLREYKIYSEEKKMNLISQALEYVICERIRIEYKRIDPFEYLCSFDIRGREKRCVIVYQWNTSET